MRQNIPLPLTRLVIVEIPLSTIPNVTAAPAPPPPFKIINGGSFASYPEPGFKILISFRDLTPPEDVVIATAVALDPDAGGDISTDGAVL